MANIVFMGTPDFAVPSLEKLIEAGHKPIAVVTKPDRERGRGRKAAAMPIKEAALKNGITTIIQPDSVKDQGFADDIRALAPDVIVVVAFSILPPAVYECARIGAFNLHGSLLPRYRGAAPVHRAVMAGETETGVTTFFLKEKVDTGNVILQRAMSIGSDETTGDVMHRMMVLGADVVLGTLKVILEGNVETFTQDDSLATAAPKIVREDCRIDWDSGRSGIHNFIRGLSPFPGAWTRHGDVEFKIFRSRITESVPQDLRWPPGSITRSDGGLWVAANDGAVEILELQQEGRKRLQADEFLRGYSLQPEEQFA